MTNEEIRDFAGELPAFHLSDCTPVIRANSLSLLLDLARADERAKLAGLYHSEAAVDAMIAKEREKMTEEKIAEHFSKLSDKGKALVLLNYLLRGGITDDDLRGLRLQWIKEQPEGVVAWITASKHYAEIYIGGDEPNRMIWGHFYKSSKEQHCSRLNRHTARLLGVELNQCAKFNIVRCE